MSDFTMLDISSLLRQLWRNKWIIVLLTLSGLLAGMALTVNSEHEVRYRATSSVCVTYTTYQEQMRGSSVMTSYSDLVVSLLVCERAAEILGDPSVMPADIQRMIDNQVGGNSYVMFINATATEPQSAVNIANAVAQAFTEKVTTVSGNNSIQVLDIARTSTPLSDGIYNKILIAALGPFVLVCAWIVLREVFSGKIRYLSQCAEDNDEILGILPDIK